MRLRVRNSAGVRLRFGKRGRLCLRLCSLRKCLRVGLGLRNRLRVSHLRGLRLRGRLRLSSHLGRRYCALLLLPPAFLPCLRRALEPLAQLARLPLCLRHKRLLQLRLVGVGTGEQRYQLASALGRYRLRLRTPRHKRIGGHSRRWCR